MLICSKYVHIIGTYLESHHKQKFSIMKVIFFYFNTDDIHLTPWWAKWITSINLPRSSNRIITNDVISVGSLSDVQLCSNDLYKRILFSYLHLYSCYCLDLIFIKVLTRHYINQNTTRNSSIVKKKYEFLELIRTTFA